MTCFGKKMTKRKMMRTTRAAVLGKERKHLGMKRQILTKNLGKMRMIIWRIM